jgi:hypothetical protein
MEGKDPTAARDGSQRETATCPRLRTRSDMAHALMRENSSSEATRGDFYRRSVDELLSIVDVN